MATIEDYFNGDIKDGEGGSVKPLSPIRPIKNMEHIVHELIDSSTEITITFNEQLHRTWGELMLKDITQKVIERALKKVKGYTIVLIGEHSNVGRFHYHGIMRGVPNDMVAKLKRATTRHIGRTEIKMISYTESYEKYMFKSYHTYPEETWGEHSYIKIST